MRGINKVILVGTLGRDPEIRYTSQQKAIANLSVATNEEWIDNAGQKQQKAEWHKVVVFGGLAEIIGQYLAKGSQVYFEGKLQTRKWQDNNGNDQYTTEVVVDGFTGHMEMLGSGQNNNAAGQTQQQPPKQNQQPAQNPYINPQTGQPYAPHEINQMSQQQ